LPTEAEWENAARGPAVNMQETMEKEAGKFSPADFVDFAEGRFENFVFGVSFTEQIFVNPAESELFQKLVKMGMPFYGWRVYGTFSGRLNHDEAWYDRASKNCVEWGPENAYGLKGMTGNVWEYVLDWYSNKVSVSDLWNPKGPKTGDMPVMRGASSYSYGPEPLQVARRGQGHMEHGNGCDGFRVAAPQDSRE